MISTSGAAGANIKSYKRVKDKCFEKTEYPQVVGGIRTGSHGSYPLCVYYDLEKGCTLNGCIKNAKG